MRLRVYVNAARAFTERRPGVRCWSDAAFMLAAFAIWFSQQTVHHVGTWQCEIAEPK
jgi:hypothetical protein